MPLGTPYPEERLPQHLCQAPRPPSTLQLSISFEDGAVVDAQALLDAGVISKCEYGVKFLGNGEVSKEADCQSCCFLRNRETEDRGGRRKGRGGLRCFRHCVMHGRSKSCARRYSSRWSSSSFTVLATPSLFLYVNIALLNAYFATVNKHHSRPARTLCRGGAFSNATIFALSIQPYINASIIIQLLCIAIPALERLSKEGGEEGSKKIASITRYATVAHRPASGLRILHAHQEQQYAQRRRSGHLVGDSHHPDLHRRLRADHVAGRADHRIRHRQRHLHDPVCKHHFPSPDQPHHHRAQRHRRKSPVVARTADAHRRDRNDRPHRYTSTMRSAGSRFSMPRELSDARCTAARALTSP